MNLDGSAVLHAEPEKVWSVITDPAVLARTIPGCETLEQVGDDEYKMNVTVGVGAIRGTYAGEVRLSDKQHPRSYVMHASGAGGPGNVRATVTINLEPSAEGTTLTYSADAVVGGAVAGVGQRMMTGVAKRMAGQFFKAIDNELTGAVVPISTAPSATPSAGLAGDGQTNLTYSADAVIGGPVAGVGQRMITGVAKRMAGQFFKAIDDELTGAVVPISAAPSAAAAGNDSLVVPAQPAAGGPQVFAGRAAAAAPAGDVRTLALGAVGGAVLTLLGVLVGYRLGRHSAWTSARA